MSDKYYTKEERAWLDEMLRKHKAEERGAFKAMRARNKLATRSARLNDLFWFIIMFGGWYALHVWWYMTFGYGDS